MLRIKNHSRIIVFSVLTWCITCLGFATATAQVLPDLQKNFAAYQNINLQEKLYAHIDKGFYLTGEILWFKIYCTDGTTNKTLNISKVTYLELLNSTGNAVIQTKVALDGGTGSGSIVLPFSLESGNYQLRAYTNWMKNFDPGYFFSTGITVINPIKKAESQTTQVSPAYDIQFFPEGGRLVSGLSARVAFKLTGVDGKGLSCTGAIVDQQNDTAARFQSFKYGIGSFDFKPLSHKTYKAVIRVSSIMITKDLPQINESGYVLRATDKAGNWNISVKNGDSVSSSNIYLIAHNNHDIALAIGSKLANGGASFAIDKNKLFDGVNYVTLFDDQGRPLCERLIFKRPAKKLLIDAQANSQVYGPRKGVNISISTKGDDNKNVGANMSVAVFRENGLQNEQLSHITGYLWLQADLKGHVESPDYYLENNTPDADQALDNLMLSQGWSQFDWSAISAGKPSRIKFLPEYTGPIITGHVVNPSTNVPAQNIKAYLTISGTPDQLYVAKSDSTGLLTFSTQKFYGLKEIVVQPNPQKDSTYRIDIASPFSEQHAASHSLSFTLNEDMRKSLIDNNINMQVQNIFAAKQLKEVYAPRIDSTAFYGKPTKSYLLDDYTRFPTMEEVLREYVGSIAVVKRQGKFDVKVFNVDKLLGNPLLLLDGMPVFDADKILKYDPLKVRKLEMVTANYLYGPDYFNGIMSFSTYRDDRAGFEIDPHAVVVDYEGLQLMRKFYSPVYGSEEKFNSPVPDFRSTLYWNPDVNSGKDGKINLSFYTSDKAGKYIGIIEGIGQNGETGSHYIHFEVKR